MCELRLALELMTSRPAKNRECRFVESRNHDGHLFADMRSGVQSPAMGAMIVS
jgi:hypothetical protein